MKKTRPNRPHYFNEPKELDPKDEFSGQKRKRGQKNAKKTQEHSHAHQGTGLQGRAENLIGHKRAGQSHKNKLRNYK